MILQFVCSSTCWITSSIQLLLKTLPNGERDQDPKAPNDCKILIDEVKSRQAY